MTYNSEVFYPAEHDRLVAQAAIAAFARKLTEGEPYGHGLVGKGEMCVSFCSIGRYKGMCNLYAEDGICPIRKLANLEEVKA